MTVIERRPLQIRSDAFGWPEDIHPVLRQVFARRRLASVAELDLELKSLTPVGQFDQLEAAVELLLRHRESPIVIVGDFDADGATSTALMCLVLRDLGFSRVGFRIPDRIRDGYGLSPGLVERIDSKDAALIITVDNGISSHEGVAAARARGVDVLVTDHHLPPETLPDANAIVNPNLATTEFPGKSLAGVGVAFYLLAALGRELGKPGAVVPYLDLVALGTVADLVGLDQSNRILVNEGIKRIRAGVCRPGLKQLAAVAGVALATVTTTTLGYRLGPRLNAAGRLDDMAVGVRCLMTDSREEAKSLAASLDELNRSRQSIETDMREQAMTIVDGLGLADADLPAAICLRQPGWHEGLVGLVASRVKERWHRPTFAFAVTADGSLKGSGRSIPGFHLRDALAEVDVSNPGMIPRYGGHAMAAGMSLPAEHYEDFVAAITRVAVEKISPDTLARRLLTDGPLAPEHLSLPVARLLRDAVPWGQGFPEPCFDDRFELVDRRVLKDTHLKLKLKPVSAGSDAGGLDASGTGADASRTGGKLIEAIAFNQSGVSWSVGETRRIAYQLSVNDFFADERVQLVIEHIADPV